MRPGESAALVALLRIGHRSWQRYAGLVEEAGSALAVLERETSSTGSRPAQATLFAPAEFAAPTELAESIPTRTPREAAKGPGIDEMLTRASSDIERWAAEGMRLLTVLDPGYPENLRMVHDRPPMIFVAGGLERGEARSVAVIGSRAATPDGITVARAVASHLVDAGFTVVSGLAAGIDTAAHTAALAAGGRTVAVIGTGLRRAYPPQNAKLQGRIVEAGAVISQFWPDTPPSRLTFPMRNAVMSGLTLASVVVEASRTSGARVQARLALAHGRPVFLHQGVLREEWARELAERPGVHVVSEPEEITRILERLTSADALSS